VGRRLRAAAEVLNPVLVDAGFLPAQYGGSPSEPVSVTFCTGFGEFAARHESFPQANEPAHVAGKISCVDLVIEVDAQDRLSYLYLEGFSLEETCRSQGNAHDADSIAAMAGIDVLDSAAKLRPILVSLLSKSRKHPRLR
jgi:hypothetical protein